MRICIEIAKLLRVLCIGIVLCALLHSFSIFHSLFIFFSRFAAFFDTTVWCVHVRVYYYIYIYVLLKKTNMPSHYIFASDLYILRYV